MKNLTEDEVIAGFYRNNKLLMALFKQNVRQEEIQRAGDYTPIDIITLLSHQQFAKMLDILYEHFKGYSNKEVCFMFHSILNFNISISTFYFNRNFKFTFSAKQFSSIL